MQPITNATPTAADLALAKKISQSAGAISEGALALLIASHTAAAVAAKEKAMQLDINVARGNAEFEIRKRDERIKEISKINEMLAQRFYELEREHHQLSAPQYAPPPIQILPVVVPMPYPVPAPQPEPWPVIVTCHDSYPFGHSYFLR